MAHAGRRSLPGAVQGLLALASVALLLAGSARGASFSVATSSLRIKEPPSVAGAYDSAIGDFGVPLYGGTLLGRAQFDAGNAKGCHDFAARATADILLVDRGDCFFVEKAWHAQQAGFKAIIVADHTQEGLVTMAVPEDAPDVAALVTKISIPTALVTKDTGDRMKGVLQGGGAGGSVLSVELDWKESIVHPDARVEWEAWLSTNDGCGQACSAQTAFLQAFKETAESLEKEGSTLFTPHFMTRGCYMWAPKSQCDADCIRGGRYCAADSVPPQFVGRQVAEENLRHLCGYKVLNDSGQAWRWWEYASRFARECTMAAGRFDATCAEEQLRGAEVDVGAVASCMGSSDSDAPHDLMEAQLRQQVDDGGTGRGAIAILPTVVINNDQYRGRLDAPAVLRALCAGFSEGSEPRVCLTGALDVNECSAGADDCWRGPGGASACMDTFRGFICRCPAGWQGDGKTCEDIDECALKIDGCDQVCVNTPGSYRCDCHSGYTLHGGIGGPGICIPSSMPSFTRIPAWLITLITIASVAGLSMAALVVYRWRMRAEMQSEIRAIMREYLPLDTEERDALGHTLLPQGRVGGGRGGKGKGPLGGSGGPGGYDDEESGVGGEEGGSGRIPARGRAAPSLTELVHQLPARPLGTG